MAYSLRIKGDDDLRHQAVAGGSLKHVRERMRYEIDLTSQQSGTTGLQRASALARATVAAPGEVIRLGGWDHWIEEV